MAKKCFADNCNFPIFAKGFCKVHQYKREDFNSRKNVGIRKTPLKKVSSKHREALKIYSTLAKEFKSQNPECQANFKGCTRYTQDVHHTMKRGKNLNNVETFMAVCRSCHEYGHAHLIEARKKGFLK